MFVYLFSSRHLKEAVWTIGTAALSILSIETFQLITGYGIFDVDDLFNNILAPSLDMVSAWALSQSKKMERI